MSDPSPPSRNVPVPLHRILFAAVVVSTAAAPMPAQGGVAAADRPADLRLRFVDPDPA